MHKVFVSFHHANDQKYKEGLVSCVLNLLKECIKGVKS